MKKISQLRISVSRSTMNIRCKFQNIGKTEEYMIDCFEQFCIYMYFNSILTYEVGVVKAASNGCSQQSSM